MDEAQLDRKMRERAEKQHGLVDREHLRALGASRQVVAHRLASPDWEAISKRVLRLVGMPGTPEQRAMAAVLDAGCGAVVSHASAAALWGFPGFELVAVDLSRRRGGRRSTGLATIHHPRFLPDHHLTERSGIPVTTLARTVVDLARREHPARVELALNAALRMGTTWGRSSAPPAELDGRGRKGVSVVRSLIAEHAGNAPLGSGLEGKAVRALLRAGLPRPRCQVDLGASGWVGRVDLYYDDVRLVVEIDGDWCHSTSVDVLHDRKRDRILHAAGFHLLRIPEATVRHSPDEAARLVSLCRELVVLPISTAV